MIIQHTEEFDLAYRFVTETSQNIFLTGKAGTGKTTFLRYLRENTVKNMLVAAPTGVAAINCRGVTLHSLFQLPFGVIAPADWSSGDFHAVTKHPLLSQIRYSREKADLLKNMDLLVIDEVSMVTCFILDAIDVLLRHIKRNYSSPFGGVQMLFIGDLYQLPPVVKNTDWEILQNYYSSIFFFDSRVLADSPPVIIELKEIFRQKDNTFIEILSGIRNNNLTEENYYLLASRHNKFFTPDESEGYITLTTHNYQADAINKEKLNRLSSLPYTFTAEITGDFPENAFPAERDLTLKQGAQVMFLKNDNETRLFFNGKIGVITGLNSSNIKVRCKDENEDIVVRRAEWQNIRYKIDEETGNITEEVVGSFIQYPLRLAWANTIHKSQGLTFEKVIIDAEKAFALGQVYVALSRCTTLEGLVLRTPVYGNYLGGHRLIMEWQNNNTGNDLASRFAEYRSSFVYQQLDDVFNWDKWDQSLKLFSEYLSEKNDRTSAGKSFTVSPETVNWLKELMKTEFELSATSDRFRNQLRQLYNVNPVISNNKELQDSIKEAASFFSVRISQWRQNFCNHPFKIETKKHALLIDKYLQDINSVTSEILNKLNICRNGFLLDNYLAGLKEFNLNSLQKVITSYTGRKNKRTSDPKPHTEHKSGQIPSDTVQESVSMLLKGNSIEEIAAKRNLAAGTIEDHISRAVKKGIILIEDVMEITEAEKLAEYFPEDPGGVRLALIKERIPFETTYGKLKIVQAWLSIRKKQNIRNSE